MTQFVETGCRTFEAGSALAEGLRVKLSAGQVVVAGSTDHELGTVSERALAQGDAVSVRLRTAQGTTRFIAVDAITAGNPFYAAASGKVSASGTVLIGIALETTTANGDVFEGLRRQEASDSSAAGGTTAAAFEVDSDSAIPKIALASYVGGSGDYTATIKAPGTLTGDRVKSLQNDGDANLKDDYCFSATPNSSAGAGNSIPVGARAVDVGTVANDADDFIVLPAIASVKIGDQIVIACNAGSNFELRTPASSNTKINDVDADGTQEYLCTDTHVVIVTKRTTTGWVAQSLTKLGAVVTAVVPD